MCIRCKTWKRLGDLVFIPVFKPHTHKRYILRHLTYIVGLELELWCLIPLSILNLTIKHTITTAPTYIIFKLPNILCLNCHVMFLKNC